MTPVLRLRPARAADAKSIADVYVEAWRSTYPGMLPTSVLVHLSKGVQAQEWAQVLGRRRFADSVVVADLTGFGVIAVGSCGQARRTGLPHAGEIFTLYVAPEYQDQGVGRALLLRLFDALIDRGLDSALTWVLAQNPGRFFYEAMGARRVAEREERLWSTHVPQVAYGWDDLRLVRTRRNVREE